jgi:RNA polymerase sigma factor (sigma-70 family)
MGSTKSSFYAVLEEAKITPRQIEICELRFVKGMTNYQIAAQLNISDKTVEKELNTAYKQITNVLASL